MATTMPETLIAALSNKAAQLRIESVQATSEAGSGHPSSCCSAADIVATLFFSVMRYDPKQPRQLSNDRFVLSKGHAAPLLYAAWAEAGLVNKQDLLKLRTLTSDLEGHPTPRLSFVDVATGSLGQGLSAGIGMALNAKRLDHSGARIYVLMGDGESVEGSVWESVELGRQFALDNLCAIVDVNRLGQSDPTMLQHDMEAYRARWAGFGWHAMVVDGHDIPALLAAFDEAARTTGKPTVLLAKTFKGKGISFVEDKMDWHGKALKKGEESQKAIDELTKQLKPGVPEPTIKKPAASVNGSKPAKAMAPPSYKPTDSVATREAFGAALAALGEANPLVVGLDADVKNSTYTDKFGKQFPDRFFENFIAEQNMVGASMGLAACGKIPFSATFACFLTRAYDFIRVAAISHSNIKLVGTHAGVSIGEDGPSQMGLEDIAMMAAQPGVVVLYPSDAVCTYRMIEAAAAHRGPVYIRTGRPKAPILYGNDEVFAIGGSKVLRQSQADKLTVVAAGVTLFEALKAHDQLKAAGIAVRVVDLYSIAPIDRTTLLNCAKATQHRILTVEDHYLHGGLGDAVLGAVGSEGVRVTKLAVAEIPHSGKPDELIDRFGIGARSIVEAAKRLV
ncbi:MAG: transketolase [Nitrospirota bacterium]|nr:transketolase [Nitrospirota bacterium]MDE3241798.1 transketolase [Nitrospirota bacterium]